MTSPRSPNDPPPPRLRRDQTEQTETNMNQTTIFPDDPRLTAYAFDEMPAAERMEFEKLLQSDPEARKAVDEIRATGATLLTALEHEPQAAPATARSATIIPGSDLRKLDGGQDSVRQQLNHTALEDQ